MEKIITKAERRAVSALTKEVRRRDECRIPKIPRTKRLLKSWFIKEFWRKVYELTNREAAQDSVPLDLRSVSSSFTDMCAESAHSYSYMRYRWSVPCCGL